MRITILNGEPDNRSAFHTFIVAAERELARRGHSVNRLDLAALDLKGCTGCWSCWVRTPGECARRDDSERICRAALQADLLLLASPMRMGFINALVKRALDQMVPLVHPYFEVEGGEIHHRPRYDRYPLFGLLIDPGTDSDAEDIGITRTILGRTARNLKSRLAFTILADRTEKEVADEIALAA